MMRKTGSQFEGAPLRGRPKQYSPRLRMNAKIKRGTKRVRANETDALLEKVVELHGRNPTSEGTKTLDTLRAVKTMDEDVLANHIEESAKTIEHQIMKTEAIKDAKLYIERAERTEEQKKTRVAQQPKTGNAPPLGVPSHIIVTSRNVAGKGKENKERIKKVDKKALNPPTRVLNKKESKKVNTKVSGPATRDAKRPRN